MLQQLNEIHDRTRAQFDKLAESRAMLDKARVELTALTKLGDLVTQEDVIQGAGKLVAGGLSPMAMAKLLSDMPERGEQLQAWLAQHVVALGQREAQLDPVLDAARHQLGVSALQSLTAQHLKQRQDNAAGGVLGPGGHPADQYIEPPPAPQGAVNPLMPQVMPAGAGGP